MCGFDMSDVLTDPDFMQQIECQPGAASVDANGRTVLTSPGWVLFRGTVTTGKGSALERSPAASRVTGSILITTRYLLRIAGENHDADRVRWKGGEYVVAELGDNSHWGAGFCVAVCIPEKLAGAV